MTVPISAFSPASMDWLTATQPSWLDALALDLDIEAGIEDHTIGLIARLADDIGHRGRLSFGFLRVEHNGAAAGDGIAAPGVWSTTVVPLPTTRYCRPACTRLVWASWRP